MILNNIFYTIKPLIPRRLQIFLRRQVVQYKLKKNSHVWPIDPKAGKKPEGWQGWPENKKFALVLSHDVDTQRGHDRCYQLMEIEEKLGFRSSFNIVPEKYIVSRQLIDDFKKRGFEVGVHGLKHDGKLFSSRAIFQRRSKKINQYIKEWGVEGFTTPSMLRNPEWILDLNVKYCTSSFDTDPFEPQPEGAYTIFPFWVQNNSSTKRYLELPYTLPQDFTLFVLMKERTPNIWKKKLDWIVQKGGMALFNSHPDYMNFNKQKISFDEYSAYYYEEFLTYIKSKYEGQFWNALPNEVANFWKGMRKKK
jgi:peptidoglycan/xylan/chitin deacetylase (PgdA/CDA1 family)